MSGNLSKDERIVELLKDIIDNAYEAGQCNVKGRADAELTLWKQVRKDQDGLLSMIAAVTQ